MPQQPRNEPALGERVVVVIDWTDTQVRTLGEGVYIGLQVPGPEAMGASYLAHRADIPEPTVRLDSGELVHAGEVNVGNIERVKEFIGERQLVTLSVSAWRQELAPIQAQVKVEVEKILAEVQQLMSSVITPAIPAASLNA